MVFFPWAFLAAGAEAVAENTVRVTFMTNYYASGLGDIGDALAAKYYEILPVAGTAEGGGDPRSVRAVQVMRIAGVTNQLDVVTDRNFSASPARYEIYVGSRAYTPHEWIPGRPPLEEVYIHHYFTGLARPLAPVTEEGALARRDFANPTDLAATFDPLPLPSLAELGSFPVSESGDYANDHGNTSVRKRIMRRLFFLPGRTLHMLDPEKFGLGLARHQKRLSRPLTRQQIRVLAEQQVMLDPDVVQAQVDTVVDTAKPQVVTLQLRAKLVNGSGLRMDIPLDTTT